VTRDTLHRNRGEDARLTAAVCTVKSLDDTWCTLGFPYGLLGYVWWLVGWFPTLRGDKETVAVCGTRCGTRVPGEAL